MSTTTTDPPLTTVQPPQESNRPSTRNNNSNRRRNRPPPNAQQNAGVSDAPGGSVGERTPRTRPQGGRSGNDNAQRANQNQTQPRAEGDPRPPRRRNRNRGGQKTENGPPGPTGNVHDDSASASSSVATPAPGAPRRNRRSKFNANLTSGAPDKDEPVAPVERYTHPALRPDDLTSTLIHSLRTHPYPDCAICFAPIHPAQPTWSCSPSIPTFSEGNVETAQCCWTVFHLKCIRAWATKSVKEVADAYRARGEDRPGEWRCPGCQSKRTAVPLSYWCFCASTPDPKPPRLATPHSCGNPCARTRTCGHPCPLPCHPGPCPPCQVTTSLPCHCGKQTLSFRCGRLAPRTGAHNARATELSCGAVCGRRLGCGNHACERVCHDGPCGPCEVKETVKCFCGKEEKEVGCGEGEAEVSSIIEEGKEKTWFGRFACENTCNRLFDCGTHHCSKPCHPPSRTPPPCPRSPSVLTHCPCGKHPLDASSAAYFPPNTNLNRTSCADPVPTCTSLCQKSLDGCEHPCASTCHEGPCPPCTRPVVRPCRCGHITRTLRCSELRAKGETVEILCDRPCGGMRSCGRHRCNRVCCPLASLSAQATKGKKKRGPTANDVEDVEGLHECDLVCGKMLSCGNHTCEETDHRGACPPCLRSSFDEMICNCGRTVLMPPIPCGTRLSCSYPCTRPPPACGHGRTPHACHADDVSCPPCPFLTRKACACGKKEVDNIRCSQENVSCGTVCGRLLGCGFHRCTRRCHGDSCGPCVAPCGKPRKLCLPAVHPCEHPCHAPSACPEGEPCMAPITLTCACGRIQQQSPCGRSTANPVGRTTGAIKCTNECAIAKRNARLAEALGINPDKEKGSNVTYSEELQSFARANERFCNLVEKSFSDFVTSEKRIQVLPHMPPDRRKFVHDLAAIYRMDTQMVDQEPQRSVQLIRRIDTRIPTPLLSSVVFRGAGSNAGGSLGRLGTNLRTGASVVVPKPASSATAGTGAGRDWTSVVAKPPPSAPVRSSWGETTPTPAPSVPTTVTPKAAPKPISRSSPPPVPSSSNAGQAVPPVNPEDVPDNWEDDL